jgi:putative ABC transport system substrate-binding protein
MKRREFIAGIGGAAAWMAGASAQMKVQRRLAMLLYSTPETDPQMPSVHDELRKLGYHEGQDLIVSFNYAEGRYERLPGLAAALIQDRPDVIFALGGDVAPYVAKATSTIPIVFLSSADPVQQGLVASLSRPGGNATGTTLLLDDTASKRLEFLKEMVPRIKHISFLWNPNHRDNELSEVQRAAQSLDVQVGLVEMGGPGDLDNALRAVTDAGSDALYVVATRQTVLNIPRIVEFTARNRLPLAGGWGLWARTGGLFSYGPDVNEMARRATGYVDRILKGAKPAELPVQQPTKFELIINVAAAKTLGITVPPSLLLRADEVIE